jgi:hypothetical protein
MSRESPQSLSALGSTCLVPALADNDFRVSASLRSALLSISVQPQFFPIKGADKVDGLPATKSRVSQPFFLQPLPMTRTQNAASAKNEHIISNLHLCPAPQIDFFPFNFHFSVHFIDTVHTTEPGALFGLQLVLRHKFNYFFTNRKRDT